ncbi:MAG TPA: lysophospholipid acyltransferase family protein [Chryseolinea sp.]
MIFARLISRLPFPVLFAISDFLFAMSYYLIGYRRKMVQKNLKNSFPEKSETELRQIEKQFYRNLCDYAVEMLKLLTISKDELTKRMVFTNPEVLMKYARNKQSVLNLASHHFNWEWLLTTASVMFPVETDFVYQPVNSPFFERISLASRTRFGAHAVKRDEVAREMVKRKNVVRNVAIVGDQYPGYKHDKKYPAKFMNQDTVFFYGSYQIALLTQYPVVYNSVKKVRRGYYEVTTIDLSSPPYAKDDHKLLENYISAVEKAIRERPAEWLWSHNRWKKRHLENI